MVPLEKLADIKGLGELVQTCNDFTLNLKLLQEYRTEFIDPKDEAFARMYFANQNLSLHSLNIGTLTCFGLEHKKGKYPVLRRKSRLLDFENAKKAVEANSKGEYFCTGSTREYDESLGQAISDQNKHYSKQEAIVLPSRRYFYMTPKQNKRILEFLLGDLAKTYYEFNGKKELMFRPANRNIVDNQPGTLITPIWFVGVNKSGFHGCIYFLDKPLIARAIIKSSY